MSLVESDKSVIPPLGIVIPPGKARSGIADDNDLQHPSNCKPANPPAPTEIQGPFRLLRILERGAFATAVAVEDAASKRLLCLKVFKKEHLKDSRTVQGLLKELEVYKRIGTYGGHIFLMQLEMSFRTKNFICFAMPLMANDLHYFITSDPAYTDANARRWSAQMALGINALHSMGIMHRDIKVENVLIGSDENVKIADFGLSYTHPEPLSRLKDYTSDVKGTTQCMAPEILSNSKNPYPMPYGIAVDWWAFGCVLFELLSHTHRARFISLFITTLLIRSFQPLFATEEAVTDYVSWHSTNYEKVMSFPAFDELDPSVVGLVAGLVRPEVIFRSGFQNVKKHPWFFTNGVSEFHDARYRAGQRVECSHMLPDFELPSGEHRKPEYLTPLPAQSKGTIDVDWRNPKSGVFSFC
ncbi:kinase-like domain-containing protein [Suillus ampliporus]|nr:kinase-like domain-containing protein [Suillus ampliporus]